MSTYTDLHNKIKENLTVGYSPDDRITTQKVRFYNEGNEYWGTFKGTVHAEKVNLDGGLLTNVKIVHAELSDISWPAGVNFDEFGAMMKLISADIEGIEYYKLPEVHSRITDEISARLKSEGEIIGMIEKADTRLSIYVDKIIKDFSRELSILNIVLTDQDREISVILGNRIDDLSTSLTDKIEEVSASLSNEISVLDDRVTGEVYYLSSELSTTQMNLAEEIGDRARADAQINKNIKCLSAISDIKDWKLQRNIDRLNRAAMLSIDILRDEAAENLEVCRHYKHVKKSGSLKDIQSYPFTLEDFAVNHYDFQSVDGQVYITDEQGNKVIASIAKASPGSVLPFDLIPYKENKGSAQFNAAFDTSIVYPFADDIKTNVIQSTGYSISLQKSITGSADQLSNYSFALNPIVENYHEVQTQAGANVGYVINSYPPGQSSHILSGTLTISPAVDTSYDDFRHFRNIPFDTKELSNYFDKDHLIGFIYRGSNVVELRRYDPPGKYLLLSDDYYDPSTTTFGKIYQQISGEKSVISDDITGEIESIKVWLDRYPSTSPYVLTKENEFNVVLDDQYVTPAGDIAILTLKADVDNSNSTAKFTVGSTSTLYKYNFKGKDSQGNLIDLGYISPKVYNRTIQNTDTDFDVISADISNVVFFESLKDKLAGQPIILRKSDVDSEDGIWFSTLTDDDGNVLDVKYIGLEKELRLKITIRDQSRADVGQIIAQKYSVDLSSPIVVPGTGLLDPINRSVDVDLFRYDYEEMDYSSEIVYIQAGVADNDRPSFTLNIDTASNYEYKAIIPPVPVEGRNALREFVIDVKITTTDESDIKFRKIKLIHENGKDVELINTTQKDGFIYVSPNREAVYGVKEICPGKFIIYDFNDEEDNQWIHVLDKKIRSLSADVTTLSAQLSTDIDTLSINLSTDIDTLSTQLSTDIDILSVNLSTDITTLSSQLSIDIDTLSAQLSIDITTLSIQLSTDIDTLSINLSTDIDTLSAQLSTDIDTISANISTDIDVLSANLSTDINTLSTQLSTDVTTLSAQLSTDIDTLSVQLSTDISVLSSVTNYNIEELSTDLSTLSSHYHGNISADIQLTHVNDDPLDPHSHYLSVDQLLIVDEVTFERYRLTIRNGALNINKVDQITFN